MNSKILIEDLGTIKLQDTDKRAYWRYKVECPICSNQRIMNRSNFLASDTTKCTDCKSITHGKSTTKLYQVWSSMKYRCNSANKDYGDRGIAVCTEWANSYKEFSEWAHSNGYSEGLTIDRKDNDKGYTPSNCHWVTMQVQADNKRTIQANNTSNYRCVTLDKRIGRWVARTTHNKKTVFIGHFLTSHEAARAYNDYVIANNLNKKLNILNKEG